MWIYICVHYALLWNILGSTLSIYCLTNPWEYLAIFLPPWQQTAMLSTDTTSVCKNNFWLKKKKVSGKNNNPISVWIVKWGMLEHTAIPPKITSHHLMYIYRALLLQLLFVFVMAGMLNLFLPEEKDLSISKKAKQYSRFWLTPVNL